MLTQRTHPKGWGYALVETETNTLRGFYLNKRDAFRTYAQGAQLNEFFDWCFDVSAEYLGSNPKRGYTVNFPATFFRASFDEPVHLKHDNVHWHFESPCSILAATHETPDFKTYDVAPGPGPYLLDVPGGTKDIDAGDLVTLYMHPTATGEIHEAAQMVVRHVVDSDTIMLPWSWDIRHPLARPEFMRVRKGALLKVSGHRFTQSGARMTIDAGGDARHTSSRGKRREPVAHVRFTGRAARLTNFYFAGSLNSHPCDYAVVAASDEIGEGHAIVIEGYAHGDGSKSLQVKDRLHAWFRSRSQVEWADHCPPGAFFVLTQNAAVVRNPVDMCNGAQRALICSGAGPTIELDAHFENVRQLVWFPAGAVNARIRGPYTEQDMQRDNGDNFPEMQPPWIRVCERRKDDYLEISGLASFFPWGKGKQVCPLYVEPGEGNLTVRFDGMLKNAGPMEISRYTRVVGDLVRINGRGPAIAPIIGGVGGAQQAGALRVTNVNPREDEPEPSA